MVTALTPLRVFLRVTEEDRAPVAWSPPSLATVRNKSPYSFFVRRSQGGEPQLGGGGDQHVWGGQEICKRCETPPSVFARSLCLLPKQFFIWGAFDYDHGSICMRSSWEGKRTCHISPTRVCSHQEQGRCQQWPLPSPEVAAELKNFFL